MLRRARIRAAGFDGEALLRMMDEVEPQAHSEWLKMLTDDQLIAIVSTPDPSGIDVRKLTDEELEAIINGE